MNPHHQAVYGAGGISQELLGQWLGLKQPQISRIETGPPIRNLDTLEYWARVLRIPAELLWFKSLDHGNQDRHDSNDAHDSVVPSSALTAGQAGTRLVSSPGGVLDGVLSSLLRSLLRLASEDGEDDMKRRAFLMQTAMSTLVGLGARSTASTLGLEVIRNDLNLFVTDDRLAADVNEWQEVALSYGQTYPVTEPAALLQTLVVDLSALQIAIHRHSGETVRRQLLQAGALLAAFTAQTVANMGDPFVAQRWWRTARRVADESGDPYTVSWIRGREVVRAGYERRPAKAILQLAQEAEARLDAAPPEVLPQFFTGKAQTLVLAGRYVEAEQTLARVRECLDALPAPGSSHDSLFNFGEENLRFAESFVYSHIGDFTRAEQAQQAALRLYPEADLRSPAQIELQRALCLVRSGDHAQGARHAQRTITTLPAIHRIRPIVDLGQKVLTSIPVQERCRGWAQEYRECFESSFPSQVDHLPARTDTRA